MNKEEYKGIFVFAEQREGEIKNVAFELIGKARELAEARSYTLLLYFSL